MIRGVAPTVFAERNAILRWNACARIIERDERLKPRAEEERIEDDADGPPIR